MTVYLDILPVEGELFSCWLYRQSMVSEVTPLGREELSQIWLRSSPAADFDPDFSQYSYFINTVCDSVGICNRLKNTLIQPPSTWLIPRFYRRTFCYQCLSDSIQKFACPTSLRKWCAVGSVVCETHNLPLVDATEVFGPKLNMAMKFFQMHHIHKTRYLTAARFQDARRSIKSLTLIQNIMSRFEMDAIQGRANNDHPQSSYWEFSKFLSCLMLYPRFGLINRYIRSDVTYHRLPLFQQMLAQGPLISSIAHRRVAMLILGWLYEILPSEESNEIRALISKIGGMIGFSDAYGLGSSCNGFATEHAAVIARRLVEFQPPELSSRTQQFINGFVASTVRQ